MKTKETGTKRIISRQTVNRLEIAFYAVFLAMNIIALIEGGFFGMWGSAVFLVISVLILSFEVSLQSNPRVEPEDELYLQNMQKARTASFTIIMSLFIILGIVADTIFDGIKITINSQICFIIVAVMGLITNIILLIYDHNSNSADEDEE